MRVNGEEGSMFDLLRSLTAGTRRWMLLALPAWFLFALPAIAQINFPKTGYFVALGDSISAGEGAMPVTAGFAYRLYDQGTFGQKQQLDFGNIAIRGARTIEVRDHQVPQLTCLPFPATVVTLTVGANDFLRGDTNIPAIAQRTGEIVARLLNGDGSCPGLPNVTILVANNYTIPHPDPNLAALFDQVAQAYDQLLRFVVLPTLPVPSGSRVALVDLYSAFKGRNGLLLIQKRNGFNGPFDFDVHPTNAGHAAIAEEFNKVWKSLQ